MRKILITNDDGIDSEGIIRLARAALEFGEVWVVAPDSQRSAASHSITLRHGIDIYPHDFPVEGVKAFSCSGTPGDCVRAGSLSVMDERPDVVLSGINFGYNVASDIQYSATAGAAFEAAFQGYHAIALSEGFNGTHEVTDHYLRDMLMDALEVDLDFGEILNINFPDCPLSEFKGVAKGVKVSRRAFYIDRYKVIEELENGGKRYMVDGIYHAHPEEGTDYGAVLDNMIAFGKVNNIGT
ncbi:5'/3'-nucleotidase SurE [Butyrivibrio sp. WCD3002]|uniref:5'/3'-nucleotidase SurE n=1 Tax=Butyrivibrio sp. WCD3002 TaxID=1280676 RepID=UPI000429BB05|nr:5'/3'-nucleotidase SurE [Butyrivibrio sp. WCD3002]